MVLLKIMENYIKKITKVYIMKEILLMKIYLETVLYFIKMAKKNWKEILNPLIIFLKENYYSPKRNLIYEGKIENDFFYNSDILDIYSDNGYLFYHNKFENKDKNQIIFNY